MSLLQYLHIYWLAKDKTWFIYSKQRLLTQHIHEFLQLWPGQALLPIFWAGPGDEVIHCPHHITPLNTMHHSTPTSLYSRMEQGTASKLDYSYMHKRTCQFAFLIYSLFRIWSEDTLRTCVKTHTVKIRQMLGTEPRAPGQSCQYTTTELQPPGNQQVKGLIHSNCSLHFQPISSWGKTF